MRIKLTVDTHDTAVLTAEPHIVVDTTTVYDGPTEFTPSGSTQTIAIANKKALTDITINPIPSNYGLITWDGSTITVS